MRAQRHDIAKNVAERLFAAEAALDVAAARIAELNAALPLARMDAHLAAAIGQDAFDSSTSAMKFVAKTRAKLVDTHASLKAASDDIGLSDMSYGDLFKVSSVQVPAKERHLRAA